MPRIFLVFLSSLVLLNLVLSPALADENEDAGRLLAIATELYSQAETVPAGARYEIYHQVREKLDTISLMYPSSDAAQMIGRRENLGIIDPLELERRLSQYAPQGGGPEVAMDETRPSLPVQRLVGAVGACYDAPAAQPDAGDAFIRLHLRITPGGNLAESPDLVEPKRPGRAERSIYRAAIDAIENCIPYDIGGEATEADLVFSFTGIGIAASPEAADSLASNEVVAPEPPETGSLDIPPVPADGESADLPVVSGPAEGEAALPAPVAAETAPPAELAMADEAAAAVAPPEPGQADAADLPESDAPDAPSAGEIARETTDQTILALAPDAAPDEEPALLEAPIPGGDSPQETFPQSGQSGGPGAEIIEQQPPSPADLLTAALQACYFIALSGEGADETFVRLRVRIRPDGYLEDLPELVEPRRAGRAERSMFRAAVEAFDDCAPFMLGAFQTDAYVTFTTSTVTTEIESQVAIAATDDPDSDTEEPGGATAPSDPPPEVFLEPEPYYEPVYGAEAEAREQALALNRSDRREIQRRLTLLGLNTKGVDGIFGPGTRAAISAWQERNGLRATGFIDGYQRETLARQTDQAYAEWQRKAAERRRASPEPAGERLRGGRYIGRDGCPRYADGRRVANHSMRCDFRGVLQLD